MAPILSINHGYFMKKNVLFLLLIFYTTLLQADCTTIYLVRHGQTDWNLKGRIQSIENYPLNETGQKQASFLSEKLKDVSFQSVITSGLTRTTETALIIVQDNPLKFTIDQRLRERNYGSWEGVPKEEYHGATKENKWDVEKDSHVTERAMEALKDIAQQHSGSNVLVVSHGGVLRNVIALLQNVSPKSIKPENAGYVILSYCEGKWSIKDMHDITNR